MSSPGARQRRRREQYQNPRTRSELLVAIGAGVVIVAGTGLMIWLLRPGGMADRQPRSSWLVALAVIAAWIAAWAIYRRDNKREMNRPRALAIALVGVVVAAVGAGFFWPGGLLRHTPKPIAVPTTPTEPLTSPPTTTSSGASTSTPATPTTQPGTATTNAPTATTAAGATPTSGATATTKPATTPTATAPPVSPGT